MIVINMISIAINKAKCSRNKSISNLPFRQSMVYVYLYTVYHLQEEKCRKLFGGQVYLPGGMNQPLHIGCCLFAGYWFGVGSGDSHCNLKKMCFNVSFL